MKLKNLLVINAIVALVYGIILVLTPELILSLHGLTPGSGEKLMAQFFGETMIAIGLLTWLARDVVDIKARRAIIIAFLISNIIGVIISAIGTVYGVMNVVGWSAVTIYLLLALGYAYFQFSKPSDSYIKPGNGAEAPPTPVVGIDKILLEKIQLKFVVNESSDAVPLETMERVADLHAKSIWGPEVARGTPLQLLDAKNEPVLYAFPFAKGESIIPKTNVLLNQFSKYHRIDGSLSPGKNNALTGLNTSVKSEAENYGTVYVSARKSNFPVTRVSHGLHPYFYNAERAMLQVGAGSSKLVTLRYLPPHEFFEIQKDDTKIRLHTHMLMTEEELRKAAKKFPPNTVPKTASKDMAKINTKMVAEAWKAYETPLAETSIPPGTNLPSPPPPAPGPGGFVFRIRHWQRMPAIDWTRWCEPTAASMVFSFWDHYVPVPGVGTYPNYPRLVDYWLDHPSNGNNVPDILDPIADGLNIDVANNLKGYSWTVDKVNGDANNNFAWNELIGHLHINHPVVWQVFGSIDHATAAFGYRILNGQKYVILYNTWSSNPTLALDEWLYNDWTRVEVDRYRPGGKELYRHLFIRRPYGGETHHVGQWNEILFNVHPQTQITKARIEYSLDGGQSWSLIVNIWVQPGWNQWWWMPPATSNKARIRIKGMADNNAYLGGDGSFNNFTIQ